MYMYVYVYMYMYIYTYIHRKKSVNSSCLWGGEWNRHGFYSLYSHFYFLYFCIRIFMIRFSYVLNNLKYIKKNYAILKVLENTK